MKIPNPYPFSDFDCYLNFHSRMGRWQVCIKNQETGERRTILYSKFKVSVREGRILSQDEEVDHKDGDKTNDSDANLEIVTRAVNVARRNKRQTKACVDLICPNCLVKFTRERRQTHLVKGGNPTCCSRSCARKNQHVLVAQR